MDDAGERQDRLESTGEICALCGEIVGDSSDACRLRGRGVICYECAARYGGVYDSENEAWRVSPELPPGEWQEEL